MVTAHHSDLPAVSVVIPALNEQGNIANLVEKTLQLMPAHLLREVIVVDDGSTDGTPGVLKALAGAEPRLRVIRHAERCGQSTALRTGMLAARSDVIATTDGDGQNDPRDIVNLLGQLGRPLGDGPALVGGHRVTRKASAAKRLASHVANRVRRALLKDESPDSGCGIRVFWRDVFLRLPFFSSMHRYLPMLYRCYGFETACHPVNDRPRLTGESKYTNFERLMLSIYDLIGVVWLRRRTIVPRIEMDSARASRAWPLDEGPRNQQDAETPATERPVASPNGHGERHDATMDG